MTHFFVDSDVLLDSESLPPESIAILPNQVEQAVQISQTITDAAVQWQTYLNALGVLGFAAWLQERVPTVNVPVPSATELAGTTCTLEISGFKLCLMVMGSLSDTVVSVPVEAIESPINAAHLYVVLEVQEEQEQMLVKAWLSADQLLQQQQAQALQPDSDGTYSLPLTWFDFNPDSLVLYLRCLQPAALPLGLTPSPQLALSAQPAPTPNTQHPTPLLNAALWLRDQLDTVAQELAWILLPPPVASAMRSTSTAERDSTTAQFERLLRELNRVGVEVPPQARGAFRDLRWGGLTVRLYALTWVMPLDEQPEWSLLLVLSTPSGDRVPTGVRLQVRDQEQLLIERTANPETEANYLYGRVIGTWSEQFWVTIDMANGATVGLPPFSFNPEETEA
jgi:hypothetical protein